MTLLSKLSGIFSILLVLSACSGTESLVETGQHYQISKAPLLDAEFSNDGKYLATLSVNRLAVQQVSTEQLVFSIDTGDLENIPKLLSLSGDDKFAAIAGDNFVNLYDIRSGQLTLSWRVRGTVEQAKISAIKLNQFGDVILLGLSDGSVSVTNLAQQNQLLYKPHSSDVKHLFFTPYEQQILTASFDGKLVLLDLATGTIKHQIDFASRITSLEFDRNSGGIFVSDALSNEKLFNLKDLTAKDSNAIDLDYVERNRHFRLARYTKDGQQLVTSGAKAAISVWNTVNGNELAANQIAAMSMSSTTMDMVISGNTLITVSSDGIVQNWSLNL